MKNCDNNKEELRLAESKKEILRRSYDLAHAQANSVLNFTVQWKDLEEHLDISMKSLEKQSNDADSKIRLLDQRAKEIESKESDLVLAERRIKECNFELACKEKQLELVRKRIGECECELQLKEGELNLVKKSVEEWLEKLDLKMKEVGLVEKSNDKSLVDQRRLENLIKDFCEQIELKEKDLRKIRSSIEECEKELVMKEKHASSLQSLIEDYAEELESKEKLYDEIKKSIIQCETKLDCKKKELELTQTSIIELSLELHLEEEKLESLQRIVRLRENELDSKEEKLDAMKEEMKKYFNDIELKEREFNGIRKCIEKRSQELTLKEKQLKCVQESLEGCRNEFEEKENELISVEKLIDKCSEELELKKKHLCVIENSAAELSDECESNELELDLIQTMAIGYLKQLKEKEKQFHSLKEALDERWQDLEIKERKFEERVKEFELREKEIESIRKAVEDRSKNLELKEKKLSNNLHLQVKIEQPESLKGNEGTKQLSLQSCTMITGKNLQLLLNQHLQKHDLVFGEISHTLTKACDPASLVLDAMEGFYPPHSREGDMEFDVSIIRRTCILLLEQLSSVTPEINPQVRDEAMKVAGEWKKKMRVAEDNSLEVLGFLHLLAAYGLGPSFDGIELESLLDIVAQHRQTSKLRQSLGFAEKAHGLQCSTTREARSCLSLLNKHDLGHNEVLQLLHLAPDPAMFVLDFIQHWKSQGTGFEEDNVKCCILVLEKLKEVLPIMNPRVKGEAMKLAVEWKTKMGVGTLNSLEVLVFLQLLGTFELVASFNRVEIVELLWTISEHKQAPETCRALGFTDIVATIRFICAFKLTDIAKPEAIFKQYLDDNISDIHRKGNNSSDAKVKAMDFEVNALTFLIECFKENKLESSLLIENIKQRIVQLEMAKADCRRHSTPAPSATIQLQLASRNNYNIGTSTPTNQPVPSHTNQPQHSGINHSIGFSASREQPQLQNNYKRPRIEPLTTRAYMPQIPASVNLHRSSPTMQHGPGVALSGGQMQFDHIASNHLRVRANMGAGQTSNVTGNQNLHHFQYKYF
ncbi:hypothetical protein CISIN_1g001522mg [Citrus sinensis]|uniref:FRIGIDA-like protein n=1 Tax=Citrus sinensis TaxID=2711 RepID=A0A067DXM9_CITSI|nr:hypothetical protein CISIN_1g001522mg [Citrus sinensis]